MADNWGFYRTTWDMGNSTDDDKLAFRATSLLRPATAFATT